LQQGDSYRQKFASLLRETIIPSNSDIKGKYENYDRLNGYINEYMPESLFRYRAATTYSIEALRCGNISVTKPCEMGDLFDSQIAVDIEQVVANIKTMEDSMDTVANHLYEGRPLPDFALQAVSPIIRRVVVSNQDFLKGNLALKPMLKVFAGLFGKTLKKRAKTEYTRAIDVLRKTGYIACFCEEVDKLTMWDRYADKHKGFALEYEFETLNARFQTINIVDKSKRHDYIILPVIYGEKYDSTPIVLHSLMNSFVREQGGENAYISHPDELWRIKGYLYKLADYEYEAEWRMITPMIGVVPDACSYSSVNVIPKAIYYGAKMPNKTRQELDSIAKANGLLRYHMKINPLHMRVETVSI